MTKDDALKLALEALDWEEAQTAYPSRMMTNTITAIKQALALDKKAENARELGLNYEPAPVQDMPKIGCVNHDCDKCKALAAQPDIVKRAEEAFEAAAQRQWVGLTRWEIDAKLKENK